ncbi:hypothetical protein [Halorussus salinus]|uniref:hypothetical protein n=1 Tax=Halorussus salinus TaxID=1364935 RepID=UPI0010929EF4|nr:hypothetical protein [Halorussus salinus]
MNRSRRHLLAASAGIVASLSGCLSSVGGDAPSDAPKSDRGESSESVASRRTTTAGAYPDTVRASTTIRRDDLEYVASNDTVRYVAAWRTNRSGETPTRKPIYETIPFEEWAEVECASAAARRVGEAIDERLGGPHDGVATGVTTEEGERTVLVEHQTLVDRDGEVVSEPSVSYRRVRRVAPERAVVEVTFAGHTRECEVPVTTRQATIRQQ